MAKSLTHSSQYESFQKQIRKTITVLDVEPQQIYQGSSIYRLIFIFPHNKKRMAKRYFWGIVKLKVKYRGLNPEFHMSRKAVTSISMTFMACSS